MFALTIYTSFVLGRSTKDVAHSPKGRNVCCPKGLRERGERGGRVNQFPPWEKYACMVHCSLDALLLSRMTDSHLKILADAWNFWQINSVVVYTKQFMNHGLVCPLIRKIQIKSSAHHMIFLFLQYSVAMWYVLMSFVWESEPTTAGFILMVRTLL